MRRARLILDPRGQLPRFTWCGVFGELFRSRDRACSRCLMVRRSKDSAQGDWLSFAAWAPMMRTAVRRGQQAREQAGGQAVEGAGDHARGAAEGGLQGFLDDGLRGHGFGAVGAAGGDRKPGALVAPAQQTASTSTPWGPSSYHNASPSERLKALRRNRRGRASHTARSRRTSIFRRDGALPSARQGRARRSSVRGSRR